MRRQSRCFWDLAGWMKAPPSWDSFSKVLHLASVPTPRQRSWHVPEDLWHCDKHYSAGLADMMLGLWGRAKEANWGLLLFYCFPNYMTVSLPKLLDLIVGVIMDSVRRLILAILISSWIWRKLKNFWQPQQPCHHWPTYFTSYPVDLAFLLQQMR